jgi:hypothetical protein
VLVVEYLVPRDALASDQHGGRCGRQGQASRHVITVESTALHVVKPKQRKGKQKKTQESVDDSDSGDESEHSESEGVIDVEDDDNEAGLAPTRYKKNIDDTLRQYIETKSCRRTVLDKFFENPSTLQAMLVPCCDNCIIAHLGLQTATFQELWDVLNTYVPLGTIGSSLPIDIPLAASTEVLLHQEHAAREPAVKLEVGEAKSAKVKKRPKSCKKDCEATIRKWINACWKEHYRSSGMGPSMILSEKQIKTLVINIFPSLDDLRAHPGLSSWTFIDKHAQDLLTRIARIDDDYNHTQLRNVSAVTSFASSRITGLRARISDSIDFLTTSNAKLSKAALPAFDFRPALCLRGRRYSLSRMTGSSMLTRSAVFSKTMVGCAINSSR